MTEFLDPRYFSGFLLHSNIDSSISPFAEALLKSIADYSHFSVHQLEQGWPYVTQKNGAAILPVLPNGSIILVKQDRPFVKSVPWEIPRGGQENNETPEQTARRELMEETGFSSPNIAFSLMSTIHPDSGILSAELPVFCAFLDQMTPQQSLEGQNETVEMKAFTWPEIRELILARQLKDSVTLSALTLYQEFFSGGHRPKKYQLSAAFFLRDLQGDYFNNWYPDALRFFEDLGFVCELSMGEPLMFKIDGEAALTAPQMKSIQEVLLDIGKHCTGRFWVTQIINGQEHIDDFADPSFALSSS